MKRRGWLEPTLFAVMLGVHLLPLAWFRFVPTQDAPSHLENVKALLSLGKNPAIDAFYETNVLVAPNLLGHALLAALAAWFPPVVADKLQHVAYAVALPVAFRFALPARARRRGYALAIFPFLYGFAFHMGFTSFSWSLVPFFATIGLWARTRGRLSGWRLGAFGIGVLLTALGHAVTFVALGAAVAGLAIGGGGDAAARVRRASRAGLAALPAIALVGQFWIRGVEGHAMAWLPLADRVTGMLSLRSLVLLDAREVGITTSLALLTLAGLALTLARGALRTGARPWLAATAATGALALFAPNELGSGWAITPRVQFLPFALAAIAVGAARRPRWTLAIGPVAGAVAAAALVAIRWPVLADLDRALREYVSLAPAIERQATLLPMQLTLGRSLEGDRWIPTGFAPFLHASGFLVAERDAVGLANYEAASSLFPIRYRRARDPYRLLGYGSAMEGESRLPCVDLFAGEPNLRVDYVLIWGPPAERDPPACVVRWLAQLESGYERTAVSQPTGRAQLWRRTRRLAGG